MSFTQAQISIAKAAQTAAAHDMAAQIRLVAGPGTGKSYSIGERIDWLLNQGIQPESIYAVSFTRAASEDLKKGIFDYCKTNPNVSRINISTLHSLALKILALGGRLTQYPVSPRVIDDWEQRNIFDEELKSSHNFSIKRCGELRTYFESIWSTGNPPLPFISSPVPSISQSEINIFNNFHRQRSQLYGCLLPGESVRQCVDHIKSGILNPISLLNISQLIVDEYQDLNNCDVEFIDLLVGQGITTFVSGDDDQSIYSFRYAFPTGIQTFPNRFTNVGQHALQLCFRCTPSVLSSATNLLTQNSPSTRINKNLQSAYLNSAPPVQGSITGLIYQDDVKEANAIAQSIKDLIAGGINPEDILILLSSRHAQLSQLESAMQSAAINLNVQKNLGLANHNITRFVFSFLRALKNGDDYLSFRTLLGLQSGVGISTCVSIANKIITNNLNFKHQFMANRSTNLFSARENKALDNVVSIMNSISTWDLKDTLSQRNGDIASIISTYLSQNESQIWLNWANNLPQDMTLNELEEFLGARSENEAREVLFEIYSRVNQPLPQDLDPKGRVRVMTLHSSKGLSANIVFLPGLEEQLLPGQYRAPYPAQIQEAARLLYVGITRARADCIVSFAQKRKINGVNVNHNASRFALNLGINFKQRNSGLNGSEIKSIINNCNNL